MPMNANDAILAKAKSLLAQQDYTVMQMTDKLVAAGFDPLAVASVITQCEEQGWLDDRQFVERYTQQRLQKGYGPFKIAHELIEKRISESLVAQVLSAMDSNDWIVAAEVAFKKNYSSLDMTALKNKQKVIRGLVNRGFNDEQIVAVLGGEVEYDNV